MTMLIKALLLISFSGNIFAEDNQEQVATSRPPIFPGEMAGSPGRIIGGTFVTAGTYPWFTTLTYESGGYIFFQGCGASLISPEWVLTAAHCIDSDITSSGSVIPGALAYPYEQGDNGGQDAEYFTLSRVVMHPDYDDPSSDNDFALLHIDGTSAITPVDIDTSGISDGYSTGDANLWTIGHGNTNYTNPYYPDDLKHVEVKYVSNTACYQNYGYSRSDITDNMMCAADSGKDSCQGDSGGPLYDSANDVLVGVVSWGEGCALSNYPGVYARISAQLDWIKEVVCNDSNTLPSWCGSTSTCSDTSLNFKVTKTDGSRISRNCGWVATKPNRCNFDGPPEACASTCGTCATCADASDRFRVIKPDGSRIWRDCGWVATKPNRCNFDGVADICRSTCGTC